ncbi:MAG: UDP-N-acetylmuramoyl-tripeptide--D-alanyl-D-alanine ligase [Gemmatimonadales bacterium]|nr:MAG: UDP-N-acetylmuramoyl-tripeptide--D-alanyl-D-alanine ligase [Gemmatimonadales bacterium]
MMTRTFAWTDEEVRAALGLEGGSAGEYPGISTDTRALGPGELFVALTGERFDGHAFLAAAAAAGARGAVVSQAVEPPEGMVLYRVEDTLVALGDLARHRRIAMGARVVGITGSSGKTSTKDFTRGALAGHFRVHATRGNRNNRVGLPLTLLEAPEDAEVIVAEMGTSEPGEIRELVRIGLPDVGVVVTVSESHLDCLVDLDGVMTEKLDMIRGLAPEAVGLVGDTPESLPRSAREIRSDVRVAGLSTGSDPELRPCRLQVDSRGRYRFAWRGEVVSLRVAGRHMAYDAVIALAIADILGVPADLAAEGVSSVRATGMRGEERRVGAVRLLIDCYNANPQSTRAALDALAARTGNGPRAVILGTMLELGSRAAALHDEVLDYALSLGLDLVVATGAFATALPGRSGATLIRAEDPGEGYRAVLPVLRQGGVLLLKASRGVALERLIPALETELLGGGD